MDEEPCGGQDVVRRGGPEATGQTLPARRARRRTEHARRRTRAGKKKGEECTTVARNKVKLTS